MSSNAENIFKILHILGEGFQLRFERDKKGRRKIHERCDKEWLSIDRKQLYRVLEQLRLRGVIKVIKEGGNIEKIALTNRAQAFSLKRQFIALSLKPRKAWDKKWRIVLFDVPEANRRARDILRDKLKQLGFLEFQKSAFVYPFPCKDEINFVINFLNIPEHVYYIEAPIVPDHKLKTFFFPPK